MNFYSRQSSVSYFRRGLRGSEPRYNSLSLSLSQALYIQSELTSGSNKKISGVVRLVKRWKIKVYCELWTGSSGNHWVPRTTSQFANTWGIWGTTWRIWFSTTRLFSRDYFSIWSEFCACAVTLTPTSNSIKKSFVQFVKHRPLLFYGLARVRFITVLDARVLWYFSLMLRKQTWWWLIIMGT